MTAPICVNHPAVAAVYRCDACGRHLCNDCVREGHRLLFCTACGDRAVPLFSHQPATSLDRRRQQAVSKPYPLTEAFFYPFRGMGLYLFVATVATLAFLQFFMRGCVGLVFSLGFWTLMVGLQFKIVRSTAEGDDELPDWPDYFDFAERVADVFAYLAILILQFVPPALYLWFGRGMILTTRPSLLFWAGFALIAWAGAALGLMALGAAGRFTRGDVIRIDRHVAAFLAGGPDAVMITNIVFALGIGTVFARAAFNAIPLVGSLAGGVIGAYWAFTSAHLAGVLFRRRYFELEKLYG
jgi:hypothetical protein